MERARPRFSHYAAFKTIAPAGSQDYAGATAKQAAEKAGLERVLAAKALLPVRVLLHIRSMHSQ
jgi:hypothetical protein